ncbi:hypothetical protein KP509_39G017100 [Ceratopteris richardii]|uniref:Uncharacterized protein n=1 Tax=Ceratopteris richardii TaxID=49495 RepID=A0A8T2PZ54_CERRI|nr:hypothetical protein KP509_39G017100 [Ceratopteris richardii]
MSPYLSSIVAQNLRSLSPDCNEKGTSDRHFVTWTEQEDEILRQAVAAYGVDKWSMIAAQLNNKTSRQCRRRWHTYLLTECKKGGWSPEEDQLLLEAHRKFGNRWTEIAKVVPGRTDNAVKNRFSALSKKQAKRANDSCGNSDTQVMNKRRALGENINVCNRGTSFNSQQKQYHGLNKPAVSKSAAHVTMAERAHPVNNDRNLVSTCKPLQATPSKGSLKSCDLPFVEASAQNEGKSQNIRSYSENVSPPRLVALSQNAAFLDSLVERRDARLKLRGGNDDTWKCFDQFTMDDSGRILQAVNATPKNALLSETRSFLYNKENYNSPWESHVSATSSIIEESINQNKYSLELGAHSSGMQQERTLGSEPHYDSCNTPRKQTNNRIGDPKHVQTDCFSSYPSSEQVCFVGSGMEQMATCDIQSQDATEKDYESAALVLGTMDPLSIELTWDSQLFMEGMASPQFSDSERQFLLSAFDTNYQPWMLESRVLQ